MKTKEELKQLKEEYEALNNKLEELSDEELKQIVGGVDKRPKIHDSATPYLIEALAGLNVMLNSQFYSQYSDVRNAQMHTEGAYYAENYDTRKNELRTALKYIDILLGISEISNDSQLKSVQSYLLQAQEIVGK